jgi:putative ABC transport system permease protein
MTLAVRSDSNPAVLGSAVRQAVFSVDKDQPVSDIEPLDQVLADSMAGRRFSMFLLVLFA